MVRQVRGPEQAHVVGQPVVPVEIVVVGDGAYDPDVPRETERSVAEVLLPEIRREPEQEEVERDLEDVGGHTDQGGTHQDHEAGPGLAQVVQMPRVEVFDQQEHQEDRIDVCDADAFDRQLG